MHQAIRGFSKLTDVLALLGGLLIVLTGFFLSLEVVLRYFFNSPTSWTLDVSKNLMLLMIWLSTPAALLHNKHVSVDFIVKKTSGILSKALITAGHLVGGIYCLVLFLQTLPMYSQAVKFGFKTAGNIPLPFSWLYGIVLVGSLVFGIAFLFQIACLWTADNETAEIPDQQSEGVRPWS